MKKTLLTLLAITFTFTASLAQSSLVATLSHQGTTTAYYGAEALSNALNSAVNGDVITLSSGQFKAANITKSVTVRGAGMETGSDGSLPTVLQGEFSVSTDNVTIEGVYHNSTLSITGYTNTNATFIKCRLYLVRYTGAGNAYNQRYIHCKIACQIQNYEYSSMNLINCVASNVRGSSYNINNCVLLYTGYNSTFPAQLSKSTITNSIVYNSSSESAFPNTDVLVNNVGNHLKMWENSTSSSNKTVEGVTSLFKGFDGEYNDESSFELTDAAAALYLGSDDTQVGIYGGSLAFDPTPTNPRVTKAKIASHSDANGKLSIELEVNGANH